MSVERDILTGLALLLDSAGVAKYSETVPYAATDTGIVFGPLQPTPYRQVAISLYGTSDQVNDSTAERRVQLYCRGAAGDSLDVGDLAQDIFDVIESLTNLDWGETHLVQCYRVSSVPQGIDANLCSERAENYALDINTPPTERRP